jgi:hypothetical protein
MKSHTTDSGTLSGPKDRSLNSYKDWIRDIARRLTTPKSNIQFTEKEWTTNWKDFWKDNHKS